MDWLTSMQHVGLARLYSPRLSLSLYIYYAPGCISYTKCTRPNQRVRSNRPNPPHNPTYLSLGTLHPPVPSSHPSARSHLLFSLQKSRCDDWHWHAAAVAMADCERSGEEHCPPFRELPPVSLHNSTRRSARGCAARHSSRCRQREVQAVMQGTSEPDSGAHPCRTPITTERAYT
jgi:hypothetical protein